MVGAPYAAAVRLVAIAEEHWAAIDGASGDLDLLSLPFDRFCNAIQWWAMQRVKDPANWLADLERPPRNLASGRRSVTDDDLDQDARAFLAFAQAFGMKPPTTNPAPAAS